MQRRQVLAGIAGSSILTAGCTGDVDEQESTNPDQAAEKIETARDSLQEAAELVEEEAAKFDSVDESKLLVDVRTDQIDQQIDEAESELDAAEKVATSDQREVIEGLRDLARWIRALSNVMAESGDVFDEFDIAMSYWDNNRFEDSAEQFQVVGNEVDEARETLTIAQERYQRVKENLDEDPGTYNPNATEKADEWLNAMGIIADGYYDLSLGFSQLLSASEEYQNERWEEAASGFANARDRFASAEGTFRNGEDQVARWLRSYFIEQTCVAETLVESAGTWRESARAAAENDFKTANQKADEADKMTIDKCTQ